MGKRGKRKKTKGRDTSGTSEPGFAHRPFRGLKLPKDESQGDPPPAEKETSLPMAEVLEKLDDASVYERAMLDVQPLENKKKLVTPPYKPKPLLRELDEDKLVMQHLDELVHGDLPFDFADTEEYIEAAAAGIDRRLVRKLRRGEYAVQAHLDLHGLNREQARIQVAEFVRKCHLGGKRCVLIVHGRGMRSENNIPILKIKLTAWLTRGAIGRRVLAFTSARPYDGGTGAVYVLLRS